MDDEWVKSLARTRLRRSRTACARAAGNDEVRAKYEAEHRLRDEIIGDSSRRTNLKCPKRSSSIRRDQLLQLTVRDMMQRGLDPRRRT